jgi:hypothetical protein
VKSYTIESFCDAEEISRAHLYNSGSVARGRPITASARKIAIAGSPRNNVKSGISDSRRRPANEAPAPHHHRLRFRRS